ILLPGLLDFRRLIGIIPNRYRNRIRHAPPAPPQPSAETHRQSPRRPPDQGLPRMRRTAGAIGRMLDLSGMWLGEMRVTTDGRTERRNDGRLGQLRSEEHTG